MIVRLVIVLAVLAGLMWARYWNLARARRLRAARPDHPSVPRDLLAGDRTWLVFTTPYCAACGPAAEHLRRHDPGSSVLMVDATERIDLADSFSVKATPTALLADADGTVLTRLVGADMVRAHVAAA